MLDFGDEQLNAKYSHAINVVKRSLDLYSPEGLAFSFNGGKDSTVLLHLLLQAVQAWVQDAGEQPSSSHGLQGVHVFFFLAPDEFPEVAEFVHACDKRHNLQLHVQSNHDFKAGLRHMLSSTRIKAIFLGTRRGDPNCHDQEFFCPSSTDWPCFMRINPILDWTYHDIWAFLTRQQLEYCRLYDRGYTSLGSTTNTALNSALLRADGTYAPAHLLADARLERVGRDSDGVERKLTRVASHSPCASLVVIGDEILSGKVADVNTQFVARALHDMGWRLQRVLVLPDDVDVLSRELQRLMADCNVVITAGGLGPTVDDVTVEAVARAFGCRVARNPILETSLRDYFGEKITSAHLKMADTPEELTELMFTQQPDGSRNPFPVLKVARDRVSVYVMPGVPHLLQRKWPVLASDLDKVKSTPFRSRVVRLKLDDETKIANQLAQVALEYPQISAGSYPVRQQADDAGILIVLECKDDGQLRSANDRFLDLLTQGDLVHFVLSVEEDPSSISKLRGDRD